MYINIRKDHKSPARHEPESSPVCPGNPSFSFIRLHRHLPLTLKMLIITILVGLSVWSVLDNIQSQRLKTIFQSQLAERLGHQARMDRLSFDRYVKTYLRSVKLFVSQKRFSDYIRKQDWSSYPENRELFIYHTGPPAWFPELSIMRSFVQPRYALLLDPQGRVREIFNNHQGTAPDSLLRPSPLLLAKSNGQNFITNFSGIPYIISSKAFIDERRRVRSILMLASPIDDEFLNAAIGDPVSGHIVVLLTAGDRPRIITSSDLSEIPSGTFLDTLRDRYLIAGTEFFDYGASEQVIKFSSLFSTKEAETMTRSVISRGRQERMVTTLTIISLCVIIMFLITRRIENLTRSVTNFSQHTLGAPQYALHKGDQLYVLEEQFRHLTEEILKARDIISQEAEEKLILEKKNMEIDQKEKQLTLLQRVTQAIGVGVISRTLDGLSAVNRQMEEFADICDGLWNFEIGNHESEDRILHDRNGEQRVFHISNPGIFDDDEVLLVRDITEVKKKTEALEHLALHDTLTDLPNRTLLQDRIQQAILRCRRSDKTLALFMMDLDRFKEINDTLGHHIGDKILREVGTRLPTGLRKTDTVARLGGDEFAILLPDTKHTHAMSIALKLLKILEKPFIIDEHCLYVGASIGIVLSPEHGSDTSTLLQKADVAMYEAKKTHSGVTVYTPAHDTHNLESLVLMGELRHAIDNGGLTLNYQPKIRCVTGRMTGIEALVRWNHPSHGFIPPDQFISIAEHTGLMKPLTMWVLNTALREYTEWGNSMNDETIPISVNLSARSLLDFSLPDDVHNLLIKWGVEPSRLEFEITESAVMDDPDHAMNILSQLDSLGVRLSIDDFGTGYSSLGYLKNLPVDEIKIDKTFVINMIKDKSDEMIVRSTVDLAHNLGLSVIAEGVESDEILTALSNMGCDGAQGYHICRPVPADELQKWFHDIARQ